MQQDVLIREEEWTVLHPAYDAIYGESKREHSSGDACRPHHPAAVALAK
jgi:hypothetical protein